jgi:pyruvate formate lyase activating enzyme
LNGIVFDIQRFSIHDGYGIRTTVFLKGCNNACAWCHNPESLSLKPQLQFLSDKCIGCGKCLEVCKNGAITEAGFNREKCIVCGKCAKECCTGAREVVGKEMSASAVLEEVLKDKLFYDNSNGGMTVSGGEPMIQSEFLEELLKLAKNAGLNTAIQTAGNVDFSLYENVLPFLDFIMYDIKAFSDDIHKKYTGVSNIRILNNVKKLSEKHIKLIIRTPVITGVNDSEEEIENITKYIKDFKNLDYYELLSYHKLGLGKFERLGMLMGQEFIPPEKDTLKKLTAKAREYLPEVHCGAID